MRISDWSSDVFSSDLTMMNAERLMVGIQGLGVAGAAYQQASAYARERLQGLSVDGMRGPVAIIGHADVRRMLLNIRAFVEGERALRSEERCVGKAGVRTCESKGTAYE